MHGPKRILAFALHSEFISRCAESLQPCRQNLPGLQGCRGNRRTRSPALGVGRKCEDVGLSWARTHQRADGSGRLANGKATLVIHANKPRILVAELLPLLVGCGVVVAATATTADNGDKRSFVANVAGAYSAENTVTVKKMLTIGTGSESVEVQMDCRADPQALATLTAVRVVSSAFRTLNAPESNRKSAPLSGQSTNCRSTTARRSPSAKCASSWNSRAASPPPTSASSSPAKAAPARKSSPAPSTPSPTAPTSRSSRSTAPRSRATCSRASCSATAAAPSPAPTATTPASIRAARDGTLFLDEIGELGLDLQPKLLRFLESGEISPARRAEPVHRRRPHRRRHQRRPRTARPATAASAKTSSTASTSSASRSRRCASAATRSRRSSTISSPAPRGVRQGPAPHRRRNDGAPAALPLARQRPPAAERNSPHGRARRAERGPHAGAISPRTSARARPVAARAAPTAVTSPSPLDDKLAPDARAHRDAK